METDELFRKLRPVLGKQIEPLWFEYQTNQASRQEIDELLRLLAMKHLGWSSAGTKALLPPPPRSKAQGAYELGTVEYAGKAVGTFGLRENEWIQHVAIFGRSGSGKTNVGFLILRELAKQKKPVLVFDWKRNYRDVAQQLGVRVFTVGRDVAPFAFNPLVPPPNVQQDTWIKKLVEVLAHVYGFHGATSYLLQRALYELCTAHEAFTFDDVGRHLGQLRSSGREGQWLQSARRVIGTLCFGPVAGVVNSTLSALLELLEQPVVLELDALTNADKTFIIEALLLWIHQYRLQQPGRERFRHAVLIEEAHHILLRHRQTKETVMDVVLREIRELGEAVVLIDQHPSLVSLPSLGNTYCTVAMNLKHGSDVAAIGNAMQLDSEARSGLGRLPVGSAIVRLQGRWPRPFLVRFPHFDVVKGSVTDDALRRNRSDSAAQAGIRCDKKQAGGIRAIRRTDEGEERQRDARGKPDRYSALLADIASFPVSGVAERYERIGVSAAAGTALKEEVLRSGLVKAGRIRLGKRSLCVLTLTSAGLNALHESGWQGDCATPDDHASAEHEFWKAWLFSEMRRGGHDVKAEASLPNGHRADLLIRRGAETAAIEVETGKSDAAKNLADLIDAGVGRIVLVATSKEALEALSNLTSGRRVIAIAAHDLVDKPDDLLHLLGLAARAA